MSIAGLASQPVAYFHPSHWGDQFLNFVFLDEATRLGKEQEINQLKEEVRKELLATAGKPQEQLNVIDAIERLGVGYHFEDEIEEILKQVYESQHDQCDQDDLYHVSTRFRILRQHGYFVSCDVFDKFKDGKGGFKDSTLDEIRGMLSLYEASHVRTHGDDILDEALAFTSTHLNSIVDDLSSSSIMGQQVAHALHQPLHKGIVRLETKHYISFYEQDASHNKTLLKLAKLDFNLLQLLHQKELQDISGWWNDLYAKAPFSRDRLVEAYFWIIGIYYEPKYLRARQMLVKLFMIVEVFDDTFDAYGSFDILKLFAEAVDRWDYSYIAQLPKYFDNTYRVLLETLDGYEKELAKEGRSYGVHYYKQQFNRGVQAWFREANWRKDKHIPKYDEYMEAAAISIGQIQGIVGSYLGMGQIANKESFEWVCQEPMPKPVEASLVVIRLLNDVGSNKYEQASRDHVASSVQCYMKETGVLDEEQVYQVLEKKVEDAWKDLNQGMLQPYAIPKCLMERILNLARAPEIFYKGRTDGYTHVNEIIKMKVAAVLFDPIPM